MIYRSTHNLSTSDWSRSPTPQNTLKSWVFGPWESKSNGSKKKLGGELRSFRTRAQQPWRWQRLPSPPSHPNLCETSTLCGSNVKNNLNVFSIKCEVMECILQAFFLFCVWHTNQLQQKAGRKLVVCVCIENSM